MNRVAEVACAYKFSSLVSAHIIAFSYNQSGRQLSDIVRGSTCLRSNMQILTSHKRRFGEYILITINANGDWPVYHDLEPFISGLLRHLVKCVTDLKPNHERLRSP
jgi:hypothetical protein